MPREARLVEYAALFHPTNLHPLSLYAFCVEIGVGRQSARAIPEVHMDTNKTSKADAPAHLSFAVSARYWVAQQQRLAKTETVSLRQTQLNLIFLFLIVLVPISTTILGLAGSAPTLGSTMTYGGHLTAIAFVNLLLWIEVHRSTDARQRIATSSLALICS
jgi:hypothetical protein